MSEFSKKGSYRYRKGPENPVSPWDRGTREYAVTLVDSDAIRIHPGIRHGAPVVAGTSFKLSRVLAELADDTRAINALAQDYDLAPDTIAAAVHALAAALERKQ